MHSSQAPSRSPPNFHFCCFQVQNVDFKDLKACVRLVLPLQCVTRGCEFTEETMKSLLEATQHKVPLQELQVIYEESGDLDQTALAIEHLRYASTDRVHLLFAVILRQSDAISRAAVPNFPLPLRFFYKHIWRQWDEEDEDDDYDYFVRCVEPRLRL